MNCEQVMMTLFCRVKGGRAGAGKGGSFQVGESGGQAGSRIGEGGGLIPGMLMMLGQQDMLDDLGVAATGSCASEER